MKKKLSIVVGILLSINFVYGVSLLELQNNFVKVVKKVSDSVVCISTISIEKIHPEQNPFGFPWPFFFEPFPKEYKREGLGSGFIISSDGFILTNYHVVKDADKITINLPDGRQFPGKVVGVDSRRDIALIKINAEDLPVAELGESSSLKVGQWAIALGNPFGYFSKKAKPTVTVGIISAVHRYLPMGTKEDRYYGDLIQTDAAINPGNSGGPLVDINGKVIGINVAIISPSGGSVGIGFAIPIDDVKIVLDQLKQGKRIKYGWLGVNIQDVTPALAEKFGLKKVEGALVGKVLPGTPAEKAGIKNGDVIIEFDGYKIEDTDTLIQKVGRTPVGKKCKIKVIRNGKIKVLEVVVGERPQKEVLISGLNKWRGMKVRELTKDMAERLGIEFTPGVVVVAVEVGSPAYIAGIRQGMIIDQIDNKPIKNMRDFYNVVTKVKGTALVHTNYGYYIIPEK